jgi:triacylglycerol lipase
MLWRLAASYPDYLFQLAALLRDPIYHGHQVPRGHGEPVLLIPGFLAGDWTMTVMSGWLNRLGYRAYFSGINWNVDCPNKTGELLRWRLEHLAQETHSPVTVVGHSLGGMLARFLGANFPEYIRHVVALGAPIDKEMRVHPLLPMTFRTLQALQRTTGKAITRTCGGLRCSCKFTQTVFTALPDGISFTSIYSKSDEVVDWRSCLDPEGNNCEVSGHHIGLIVNRRVYRILANVLAHATIRQSKNGTSTSPSPFSD